MCPKGANGFCDEFDRQAVIVGALPIAVRIQLIERTGCDAGSGQAQHQPGEHVRQVELTGIAGVGQDHVAAEDRHRQAALLVSFAQQHLAGPLAVRVAVGVAVVDPAGRADGPDVGVLGERLRRICSPTAIVEV